MNEHVLEKRPANHAGRHSGRGWGLNHLWRGELADLEVVAQSWFEDGPDIVQVIAGARGRNCAGRASILPPLLWLPRTQIRAYRWCSPPRIGCAIMSPNRSIGRVQGASLPSERCLRTSL